MKQKAEYIFSSEAAADLSKIFEYTIFNYGRSRANGYNKAIMAGIDHICENPDGGRTRVVSGRNLGFRYLRAAKHYIFYYTEDEIVNIVRILHGKMDFQRHLP